MNKPLPSEGRSSLLSRESVEQVARELETPERPLPSLDRLLGGLPDERTAEEILQDLEELRARSSRGDA